MRKLLAISVLVLSLYAEYPVAKFGWIDGEVYILRHGKLIKAYDGYKIDEYDTIYSKNYSKAKIIFNNGTNYDIVGRQSIDMQKLLQSNKMLRVKTTKQIEQEKAKKEEKKEEDRNFNTKFYKQRAQVEQDRMEKEKELQEQKESFDRARNIYIFNETHDIHAFSEDDGSHISIGNVDVEPSSNVKNIIIKEKSTNVSNIAKGKHSHTTTEVGNIHVK